MKIALACGAALLCAAPTHPLGSYAHDEAAIVLVNCDRTVGTAFKVGVNTYVTAHHVVDGSAPCSVNGVRVSITHADQEHDYATFIGPASPAIIKTSCRGFRFQQMYMARGFPGGRSHNIFTPWQALGFKFQGFDVFVAADAIPGMSGGPVLDGQGRAAGILVRHSPARAIALRETGFCKRAV